MKVINKEEVLIQSSEGRNISLDIHYPSPLKSAIPILFCHGFKGFKDWGCNNLLAHSFAEAGFFFIKFNFSHNGVSPDHLEDISDPQAFGRNTLSMELDDLKEVIDWLSSEKNPYLKQLELSQLTLIGHSRGGSVSLIKTIEDARIKKLICWAPVLNPTKYMELKNPADWREEPAMIQNGRTGEVYPLYYSFYEDLMLNRERFNIQANIAKLDKPLMIIHGDQDEAVPVSHSRTLYEFVSHSLLIEIENGNHTFGASHPWTEEELPEDLMDVVEECVAFIEM